MKTFIDIAFQFLIVNCLCYLFYSLGKWLKLSKDKQSLWHKAVYWNLTYIFILSIQQLNGIHYVFALIMGFVLNYCGFFEAIILNIKKDETRLHNKIDKLKEELEGCNKIMSKNDAIHYLLAYGRQTNEHEKAGLLDEIEKIISGQEKDLTNANLDAMIEYAEGY